VEGNTFISPENPQIQVVVDKRFAYVGRASFVIDKAAAGNRFIFVHITGGKSVSQMFIIQQEGFLPSSNDTYKYPITNPVKLGSFEYQHSVMMYDNDAAAQAEPGKEADVTRQFLARRGYIVNPALVMSRFARPADSSHKHEIIFFCFEDLSSYGHKLADFPENSDSGEKQRIKEKADEDCRNAFRVAD